MANDFCKNLSNAVYLQEKDGDLFYQPCCWVPLSPLPIKNKVDLIMARGQLTNQIKQDVEKNCKECLGREKNGFNRSHRITANSEIPDFAKLGDSYSLTVQVDSTCNAACVTCGPHFSSLWKKQLDPNATLSTYDSQYQTIFETTNFDTLQKILFLGGEPLLSSHNVELLRRVKNPENVSINYTTNGSVFPDDELVTLWKKFKAVNIVFSIDGTHEQFEYIRWPISWKKLNENLNRFSEIATDNRFTLSINSTINPLNIMYFEHLESWSKNYSFSRIMPSACYGTWGVEATPLKMRKYIEEKYGSNHKLVGMLKSYPEQPDKFPLLLAHAAELDKKRGFDYREVFKEALTVIDI